jgi:hypothetical protein
VAVIRLSSEPRSRCNSTSTRALAEDRVRDARRMLSSGSEVFQHIKARLHQEEKRGLSYHICDALEEMSSSVPCRNNYLSLPVKLLLSSFASTLRPLHVTWLHAYINASPVRPSMGNASNGTRHDHSRSQALITSISIAARVRSSRVL